MAEPKLENQWQVAIVVMYRVNPSSAALDFAIDIPRPLGSATIRAIADTLAASAAEIAEREAKTAEVERLIKPS